jgi:acyl carrier protein
VAKFSPKHDLIRNETRSTWDRLREVIMDVVGGPAAGVQKETTFDVDLGADSLDIAEIVIGIEDEFEVTLPDDPQPADVKTVGDLAAWVERSTKLTFEGRL